MHPRICSQGLALYNIITVPMNTFLELSLIILLATAVCAVVRLLKQPIIIGYILTGILIGPQVLGLTGSESSINAFSQVGIAILLFIVGLGLSPKVLKEVGKPSLSMGLGQVVITAAFGFILAAILGFSQIESLYLGMALTFSSTVIVLKLLSDRHDLEKLYGRISIGVLLVQDVTAAVVLIFVSAFSNGNVPPTSLLLLVVKGVGITGLLVLVALYILPRLSTFFARSQEYLFLFSMGWGLGVATLFSFLGLSVEIGALIAGVTLSVSPYNQEIAAKLRPLRDFFIILFFVYLGSNMVVDSLLGVLFPALVLSGFVLLFKPLAVMILSRFMGYGKKTGFYVGISLAQVSEFSLILVLLGIKVGHLGNSVLSVITIVALVTIAVSAYLITQADALYVRASSYLGIFDVKHAAKEVDSLDAYDVILFGCNRVGYDFLKIFKELGESFLVVDFDPDVIKVLDKIGVNHRYGDAEDGEFLDELGLAGAKMVVSTIPDFDANAFLVTKVRQMNKVAIVILLAHDIDHALRLYVFGASYVILPHFVGGHFAAMLSKKHGFDAGSFAQERDKHIEYLRERKSLGHVHPRV